jgi:hypothetical protein
MKCEISARWQNRLAIWGLLVTGLVVGYLGARWSPTLSVDHGAAGSTVAATGDSRSLLELIESSAIANSPAWLDTASRGNKVSMATGLINDGVEGIFALDHQTGNLFCWVLDPRNLAMTAEYATNVPLQLGLGPGGDFDFVMTTGQISFQGGRAGNLRPVGCIVYVAEGNSGKVGAFSFNWAQPLAVRGAPQQGPMNLVFLGTVRSPLATRDQ